MSYGGHLVARAGRACVRYYREPGDFRVFAPDIGEKPDCFFSLFWALAALTRLAPDEVLELYEGEWI